MKELPVWIQLLMIAVLMPAAFWLKFRRVDEFALGFTAFLLLLAVSVHFLPALTDRYSADQAKHPVTPGAFDLLGVVWLLSIPLAPLAIWLIGSLTVVTNNNWQAILGTKTLIGVALPIICVLPLLRYIRGDAAPIAILILAIGTLFPVSFGLTALQDLRTGPQRETVVITRVQPVVAYVRRTSVETDILEVELEGGRTLRANARLGTIELGPQPIKYLRATKTLLVVQRQSVLDAVR
jgi:hypothetical protein